MIAQSTGHGKVLVGLGANCPGPWGRPDETLRRALRKIEAVRRRIDATGKDIRLEVDGGIKTDNIRRVADAGADTFVAGSAIFGKPDYKGVIDAMRQALSA